MDAEKERKELREEGTDDENEVRHDFNRNFLHESGAGRVGLYPSMRARSQSYSWE